MLNLDCCFGAIAIEDNSVEKKTSLVMFEKYVATCSKNKSKAECLKNKSRYDKKWSRGTVKSKISLVKKLS